MREARTRSAASMGMSAAANRGVGGSVRNVGGARGISVSDTARALKTLTGQ